MEDKTVWRNGNPYVLKDGKYRRVYQYDIPDCEHDGDIDSAYEEVANAGGEVVYSYWNGEDCGEAYLLFTAENKSTLKKLHII